MSTKLTQEQLAHNKKLDSDIEASKKEWNDYVADMNAKRDAFYKENPDFPFKGMFMVVCAPRQVGGIRYIE